MLQTIVSILKVRLGQGGVHRGAWAREQPVDGERVGGGVAGVGAGRPERKETFGEGIAGVKVIKVGMEVAHVGGLVLVILVLS